MNFQLETSNGGLNMHRTVMLGLLSGTFLLLGGQVLKLGGERAWGQTPKEKEAAEKNEDGQTSDEPAPTIVERLSTSWTCSMHPHVRQSKSGKCPICGMELISLSHQALHQGGHTNLDAATARAVRDSPDVRAAQARLRVAEAELQQARLQALERIIALRRERRRQQLELQAVEPELHEAQQSAASDKDQARSGRLVDAARRRVQLLRQRLAETDALLSLASGHRPPAAASHEEQRRRVIEKELLPKAEAALKMSKEAYQAGELELDGLLTWSQRVAELKIQLARTAAEKRAAFDALRDVLQAIRDVAAAKHRAGQAPVTDVFAVEYRIAELKLQLPDHERQP